MNNSLNWGIFLSVPLLHLSSPFLSLLLSNTFSQSKLLITRDHNNVKNSPQVSSFCLPL